MRPIFLFSLKVFLSTSFVFQNFSSCEVLLQILTFLSKKKIVELALIAGHYSTMFRYYCLSRDSQKRRNHHQDWKSGVFISYIFFNSTNQSAIREKRYCQMKKEKMLPLYQNV